MSRTTLLQERRMQTFQNVLGHWQARRLSALEAAEMLGMSERSFRRYRRRYEDDGLDGLFDRRLDKASARRVPADRIEWVLEQYRSRHTGWTVKHFHDHLCAHHGFAWSYTWTTTALQPQAWCPRHPGAAPTVAGARASPAGMMLHQESGGVRPDRHHGRRHQRDLFGLPGRGGRHRVHLPGAEAGVHRQGDARQPLHRPRQPLLSHPRGRRQGRQGSTHPGRPRPPSARHRAHRCLFARPAAAPSAPSAPSRTASSRNWRWRDRDGRSRRALHRRHLPARPQSAASPPRPRFEDSAFVPLEHPGQIDDILCRRTDRTVARDNTVRYERRVLQIPATPARHHYVKARVRVHEYPDGTLALFHGPRCLARYTANGEPVETPTRQAA